MGAGTDPTEGAALGRAILDELDSIGCRAIVTTHIGDLKTYAFSNPRAENAAVEFDLETLRPRYRLHIGDIGQSNALEIARRLKLPEHVVARASRYLAQNRGDELPELAILQKLRKEAEDARQAALAAQAEAERTREALQQRLTDLQRQAENDARLEDARARLQPGDRVVVPRFGYDRPGRVVKLDPRKKTAVVAIGQMQWDVAIAELIPQNVREPESPPSARVQAAPRKGTLRLDDFPDEPLSN
jgi:DNA mismatch repair protein MutS2